MRFEALMTRASRHRELCAAAPHATLAEREGLSLAQEGATI